MAMFPNKVKVLAICRDWRALLHKKIAAMVQYAVLKGVANIVEILTDASLLTPNLSDSLISSGLSRLVVSLQGTREEKYKEMCGRI